MEASEGGARGRSRSCNNSKYCDGPFDTIEEELSNLSAYSEPNPSVLAGSTPKRKALRSPFYDANDEYAGAVSPGKQLRVSGKDDLCEGLKTIFIGRPQVRGGKLSGKPPTRRSLITYKYVGRSPVAAPARNIPKVTSASFSGPAILRPSASLPSSPKRQSSNGQLCSRMQAPHDGTSARESGTFSSIATKSIPAIYTSSSRFAQWTPSSTARHSVKRTPSHKRVHLLVQEETKVKRNVSSSVREISDLMAFQRRRRARKRSRETARGAGDEEMEELVRCKSPRIESGNMTPGRSRASTVSSTNTISPTSPPRGKENAAGSGEAMDAAEGDDDESPRKRRTTDVRRAPSAPKARELF